MSPGNRKKKKGSLKQFTLFGQVKKRYENILQVEWADWVHLTVLQGTLGTGTVTCHPEASAFPSIKVGMIEPNLPAAWQS